VRIMTHRVANRLDGPRRVLLGAVGAAAVAVPLAFGFMHPALSQAEPDVLPDAKFEVASIRPARAGDGRTMMMRLLSRPDDGRLYADNVTLKMLIHMAYQVQDSQITGGPSWMDTDRFDIQATADSALDAELRKLTPDQGRAVKERMLQRLLADRFQLTLRHETKELPIYSLVVAKGGPKLPPTKVADDAPGPDGVKAPGGMGGMFRSTGPGQITVERAPVSMFAQFLARELNRTVLDKTGLTGRYDFSLQWTPDENEQPMGPPGGGPRPEGAPAPQASGPSLFTALEDQLGLKLESQKGPVDVLGIDHVEKPSEN
jgi:bla regulator protein blaR1